MPPVICGHRVGTPQPGCSPTQHQCWQSKELHRTRGAQQAWEMWRGSYWDCGHYCRPMGSGLTAGGIQIPGINHHGTSKASCQLPAAQREVRQRHVQSEHSRSDLSPEQEHRTGLPRRCAGLSTPSLPQGRAADRYPTPMGSHSSAAQPVCTTDGDSLPPCREKREEAANRDLPRTGKHPGKIHTRQQRQGRTPSSTHVPWCTSGLQVGSAPATRVGKGKSRSEHARHSQGNLPAPHVPGCAASPMGYVPSPTLAF